MDIFLGQAKKEVPGDIHVAVRLMCRNDLPDKAFSLLETIDITNDACVKAFSDALKQDMPISWADSFLLPLLSERPEIAPIVSDVAGYRRIDLAVPLLQAIEFKHFSEKELSRIVHGLGRMQSMTAKNFLVFLLNFEQDSVLFEAALALLRLTTEQSTVVQACRRDLGKRDWPGLILALCADASVVPAMIQVLEAGMYIDSLILGLGVMGDSRAVAPLIRLLRNESTRDYAAAALDLMTGAKVKSRGSGDVASNNDPSHWELWWKQNAEHFNPRIRYRNGRPYSPHQVLAYLAAEHSGRLLRAIAYEELVIRYGLEVRFEPDMFVHEQKQAIASYSEMINRQPDQWPDGSWQLAGRLL